MARIDKYGKIEEIACSGCGNPIKTDWVYCLKCGENLKDSEKGKSKTDDEAEQGRFVCPGCGEKATAADDEGLSRFCRLCSAFVHYRCMKNGRHVKRSKSGFDYYEKHCPVCAAILIDFSAYKKIE